MNCSALEILQEKIVACRRCPRLRRHCTEVARLKRRAYLDQEYWGRPVPSFGDPGAALLIVGLAPGAHGANRTGRMFTGDRSGDWLFRALHQTGFASQPASSARGDGLRLTGAYITASAHCAPPDNKPTPGEIRNCRPYLECELDLLPGIRVVVALGRVAFENYLAVLRARGVIRSRAAYPFAHGCQYDLRPVLIGSYHPSQQNTSTGRLTGPMLLDVFQRARHVITRY